MIDTVTDPVTDPATDPITDPAVSKGTPEAPVSVSVSVSVSRRGFEVVCGRCGENIQRRGCSCDAGRGRHEAPRQGWRLLTKGEEP